MTENIDVNSPAAVFPGPLRHRPELFITGKGRIGVYHLVDHLLQAVCWGYDKEKPGSLDIDVKTDGTLIINRSFETEEALFPELPDIDGPSSGSLANDMFRQCLQAIGSKKFQRTQQVKGNPYLLTFLTMAIGLSSRAKVKLTEKGSSRVQNYKDGLPVDSLAYSKGELSAIELEAVLDSEILGEEVRAYPFRIRVQELACLFPGLTMDIRYKGFQAEQFCCVHGMKDLVDSIVPEDDRLHPDAFCFETRDGDIVFEVALYLVMSEMEKIKVFAGFSETCHGGVHDDCLRDVLGDLFLRLFKFQFPDRRQSLDNIASSRMTYFGKFGSTVPFQKENRGNQFVKIVPGVAACVRMSSPNLQWEKGSNKSRLTGPSLTDAVQPELTIEFRRWLLEHAEVFKAWKQQWAPKKRRRRTPPSTAT